MGEAAAEISKAGRVGVEEDSMDLAVGNGQGDSGEGIPVSVEDQRGLPVELSLFDFELGATGRRGHEGGHVRRALERPPEVADAPQEAWLRWHGRDVKVELPKAFLVTVVTRLCLNELDSARARREESRSDRLPEPVNLEEGGMSRLEDLEQLSMAILVVLERLSPAERAVLLLHDVFDFRHEEIAELVSRSTAACRKLLERARQRINAGRRLVTASREEYQRLLDAFLRATSDGDVAALADLLAADAVFEREVLGRADATQVLARGRRLVLHLRPELPDSRP